jgi:hypothetical protein
MLIPLSLERVGVRGLGFRRLIKPSSPTLLPRRKKGDETVLYSLPPKALFSALSQMEEGESHSTFIFSGELIC